MKRSKTYTPELREEAVKLVLTQGLTLDEAAQRVSIPKGTLGNWVVAAKRGTTPKAAPGSRSVPELEAEAAKLRIAWPGQFTNTGVRGLEDHTANASECS